MPSARAIPPADPLDHRDKSAAERAIEARWQQVLASGGSTADFQRAYDELHAEFLREQGDAGEGDEATLYGWRAEADARVHAVILRCIGRDACVLEAGTGHGVLGYLLARQGNRVLSVDVSQVSLEKARARWGSAPGLALRYEFGDARAISQPDGAFDFVVSENMVEHFSLADMRAHLREVYRLLAPGGSYLLYAPPRLWNGRVAAGFHLHMYTLREMCALLREMGFRPTWMEPRLLHRSNKLWKISGPLLWLAWGWEALLGALRVYRWPVGLRARVIPSIMVGAQKPSLATDRKSP
jgi:2-polyprenyl-3-methyl-5-hydroxy-6-metoxy-1,4-benzoquinol methylase